MVSHPLDGFVDGFVLQRFLRVLKLNRNGVGCGACRFVRVDIEEANNLAAKMPEKAKEMKPDYFLVLPWAFRNDIILREKETLSRGVKLIFPLPFVEIVG